MTPVTPDRQTEPTDARPERETDTAMVDAFKDIVGVGTLREFTERLKLKRGTDKGRLSGSDWRRIILEFADRVQEASPPPSSRSGAPLSEGEILSCLRIAYPQWFGKGGEWDTEPSAQLRHYPDYVRLANAAAALGRSRAGERGDGTTPPISWMREGAARIAMVHYGETMENARAGAWKLFPEGATMLDALDLTRLPQEPSSSRAGLSEGEREQVKREGAREALTKYAEAVQGVRAAHFGVTVARDVREFRDRLFAEPREDRRVVRLECGHEVTRHDDPRHVWGGWWRRAENGANDSSGWTGTKHWHELLRPTDTGADFDALKAFALALAPGDAAHG